MSLRLRPLVSLAALLIVASSLLADSIDDAAAKARGVPVQQIQLENEQQKNAALQAKVTDLKAKLKTAEADEAALKNQVDQLTAKVAELTKKLALVVPSNDLAVNGATEINTAILETMGGKYTDKPVKMTGLSFSKVLEVLHDSANLLPNVVVDNGKISQWKAGQPVPQSQWIGFMATDSNDRTFARFYASKKDYADLLVRLKDGQKLNIKGVIVQMNEPGWYGFICLKIEVVPTTVPAEAK